MFCNATAVLKIYKELKNYHPQVYVEEFKYTDAGDRQCNTLSDVILGFLRRKKNAKKLL